VSVTILETLSPEDLERFRTVSATMDLVQARPPTLSLADEEIRRVYLDFYALFAELMQRYGIEGEEAIEAKIAPATGHIYIGSEE
jgi:hypothetical protein